MRRVLSIIVGGVLVAGLTAAAPSTATAATDKVTIGKISGKKVKHNARASIRPKVTKTGHVAFESQKLTVKKGSATIARNRTSVRLKAGTYKVTTTVRYRYWSYATRHVPTSVLAYSVSTVVPVTCTVTSVDAPTSTVWSPIRESCAGAFDGAFARTGTAARDAQTGLWTLTSGVTMTGTVAQDLVGQSAATSGLAPRDLYRAGTVAQTYQKFGGVRTKQRRQNLTIISARKRVAKKPAPKKAGPSASGDCPDSAPIKGNGDSGIYHVPGGQFYDVTNAEECFASESAAVAAGYRKSKR